VRSILRGEISQGDLAARFIELVLKLSAHRDLRHRAAGVVKIHIRPDLDAAKVGIATIRRVESLDDPFMGKGPTLVSIQQAFERAGIRFVEADSDGGIGLRFERAKTKAHWRRTGRRNIAAPIALRARPITLTPACSNLNVSC
jgi:hypothetical protein